MRKTVEDRITTLQRKTIVRPTVEVLAGLVGPDARACWDQLVGTGRVATAQCGAAVPVRRRDHRRAPGQVRHLRLQPHRHRTQPPLSRAHQPSVTATRTPSQPRENPSQHRATRHTVVTGSAIFCDGLDGAVSWGNGCV